MTTLTLDESEYLEQLLRFDPEPDVDLDARWGITVAGLREIGALPWSTGFHDEPVIFRHGRWIVVPR